MGLFTPKWKSKKSKKREQWIAKADENKPKHLIILAELAKSDKDKAVRNKAVSKITDTDTLAGIAQKTKDKAVAMAALSRIEERDLIEKISENAADQDVKQAAKTHLRLADIKAGKVTKPAKLTTAPGKMLELKLAILKKDYNMLFLLLDEGVDVNATIPEDPSDVLGGDRETLVIKHALSVAEDKGDNTILQILTAYGLNLNVPMWDNKGTALFSINSTVCYAGSKAKVKKIIKVARFLVGNGLDINRVNSYRTTPLLDMVNDMRDYGELLCKFYIENGANPFIGDTEGKSPASLKPELFKGIENNFDTSDFDKQFEKLDLFEAAEYAFSKPLQIWLEANNGKDIKNIVNSTDQWGMTPLYRAINSENYEGCKLLIENGADINKKNKSNYNLKAPFTLLHYLAFSVQDDRNGLKEGVEFAEYLIEQGAELDKTTEVNPDIFPQGATALNIASCMNSWKMCRLFIEKGASQNGLKPHLHDAVSTYNNSDAKKLLVFLEGNSVTQNKEENTQDKKGLAALEFIVNLNKPPFDWSMIAERANSNMFWLLEDDEFYDHNTWLEDEFKKLLANRVESAKVLKAWLLPRLKHEEATRKSTYPTSIVLQIIGLLDRSLLVEIIDERLTFIGNTSISSNDETYYHKLDIMQKTFNPIIATLFRRADGCRIRKEGSTDEKLTGNHALFLNEQEEEFKTIWQIISKNSLFKYFASTTNTVAAISDGSILRKAGFCGSSFIKFLENLPPENNSEMEELRTRIINNNQKVIKEINEQYGYY